jgi:hypothetical protein
MTIDGKFTNLKHNEFKTIHIFNTLGIDRNEMVLAVRCNGGVVFNKNDDYAGYIRNKMELRRYKNIRAKEAKKEKTKKESHKIQGLGIEFNSSMAFYIMDPANPNPVDYYIIKVFRGGEYNFLAAVDEDFSDFNRLINYLADFIMRYIRKFQTLYPAPEFISLYNNLLLTTGSDPSLSILHTHLKPDENIINESYSVSLYKWVYDAKIDISSSLNLYVLCDYLKTPESKELDTKYNVRLMKHKHTPKHSCVWLYFYTTELPKKYSDLIYITVKLTARGKVNLNGRKMQEENIKIQNYIVSLFDDPRFLISAYVPDIPSDDDWLRLSRFAGLRYALTLDCVSRS